ncbi:type IV pilus secretin family protein [Chlorogloea sp. CCALA 695]|uniref:type IV pilus secretin family protein n=1 Tax=Chlorogloea sp. CCALA 695 TaxID=2107693 RepID=UPI000D04E1FE|nr:type IV pilus secretin family protein [Chlorogloea sp. CCALA 695]PSB32873.1 type II and III secretion system protein [Chlorogloea sp. CCALA 695]
MKCEDVKNPWINGSVIVAGATVVLMAAHPGFAQVAKVINVQLNQTSGGLNLVLETSTGKRPQIFTSKRGNSFVADIINTQLQLPQGDAFRQVNPAPGVASVIINRLDANSIRIVVTGSNSAPNGQISDRTDKGFTLSLTPAAPTAAAPSSSGATPTAQNPGVMVPNPNVTIDGVTTSGAVAPTLPRAVAPPVGDIAISSTDSSAAQIDLGTQERVPRLVLREAPVREVLALLARAAGLNLAFSAAPAAGQQNQPNDPATTAEGPKISLDIENESVQDVFNYVLRLSGLQANREGRTIFVGTRLPNQSRDLVVRSLRLNQVTVGVALNFLVGMGAESAVSRERTITSVNAVPVGGSATPATQTQTSTETRIELQRIEFQDSTPLLRGLQALGDERTNSVTLIGTPKQLDVATAQLVQLDSRRRQVAINVKIVDVNLLATEDFNTSFSFGIGNNFFTNNAGSATINIAGDAPRATNNLIAGLQAQVVNGNAKVLTDPTLIVQEGQQANVNLTQEVVGEITTIFTDTEGSSRETQEIEKVNVGLTVTIRVERIDDNGFVALSVAPIVKAPQGEAVTSQGDRFTLISERSLNSGLIRLRDNQTLILSGIIQDSDRTTVSKVPILGDIPLLGALFRSTNRQNQRQEVIVLLTPQILDDSERSSAGFENYNPGADARQLLERSRSGKQLKEVNTK